MNYTVTDIDNLNLKREWLIGYSRVQVERVMAKVKEDYFEFEQEYSRMLNEIAVMKATVQQYKTIEESLQHTLIIAHSTGEGIKLNAAEKAENIVQEAQIKAKKIVEDAEIQVERIKSEYEEIKSSLNCYKLKTQSLLSSFQDLLKVPVEEDAE